MTPSVLKILEWFTHDFFLKNGSINVKNILEPSSHVEKIIGVTHVENIIERSINVEKRKHPFMLKIFIEDFTYFENSCPPILGHVY